MAPNHRPWVAPGIQVLRTAASSEAKTLRSAFEGNIGDTASGPSGVA